MATGGAEPVHEDFEAIEQLRESRIKVRHLGARSTPLGAAPTSIPESRKLQRSPTGSYKNTRDTEKELDGQALPYSRKRCESSRGQSEPGEGRSRSHFGFPGGGNASLCLLDTTNE